MMIIYHHQSTCKPVIKQEFVATLIERTTESVESKNDGRERGHHISIIRGFFLLQGTTL